MKQKITLKLLSVKGHQLLENAIKTQDLNRGFEILFNMRRNARTQMVGMMDSNGKKYFVGNVIPREKLTALCASPEGSTWDHLTLGIMKYKVEHDASLHVVQVNARDPIYVLIGKGDVVLDPLMNQIFPPIHHKTAEKTRE